MEKPVRSYANFESVILPLVAAFKVPKLSDACKILFVNSDTLTLSAELEYVGIVELQGLEEGNIDGADFVISESLIQLSMILQKVIPRLFEKFKDTIISAQASIATIQDEKEQQAIIAAKIVEKVKSEEETEQFFKSITPHIGGAIKPFAEVLVGNLYKFFYARYESQRQVIPEFQDVVASLKRLGLLSPFLSIALCPSCNNYEFVFSRSARFSPNCPKCGSSWPVLTVNEFTQTFAALKTKNADLPVFISFYLKSKSTLPVEIVPNAEFNLGTGKVEVDVYIPDITTGIECKCYTNNVAVADSTIKSEAGRIKKQIGNYLALGLTRVVVITNYDDADTDKLAHYLNERLKRVKGLKELKIVSSDMTTFAKFLDEEAKRINDAVDSRMQKELEYHVAGQLPEHTGKENTQ